MRGRPPAPNGFSPQAHEARMDVSLLSSVTGANNRRQECNLPSLSKGACEVGTGVGRKLDMQPAHSSHVPRAQHPIPMAFEKACST